VRAPNPSGKLLPGMTANAEITSDRARNVLRIAYDATRFQPPKEILEAMGGPGGGQGGQRGGQRGPGGPGGPGGGFGPGGNNPMGEWLKEAGVDAPRAQKIMAEMQTEMERMRASMPMPQQQGGAQIIGGGGFGGPPPSIVQQQQMQEMRAKMEQTREKVLRANLKPDEYATVEKHRVESQSQKRVTVYKLNEKGELERHMLMIGLSDGNFAQVVRGAEIGDKFVVRSAAPGKGEKK
jgi:HlyD family secretion protein